MAKGVPDYFIAYPNRKYSGLFLEMKRKNGLSSKKNESQDEFLKKLNGAGYYACYAYGADHAIELIRNYINDLL